MKRLFGFIFFFMLMVYPFLSYCDSVILNNNTKLEGIVKESKDYPDHIIFINGSGEIRIEKTNVKKIEKEEEYISLTKVADQMIALKNYPDALDMYKKALELSPDNKELINKISSTEHELEKIEMDKQVKTSKEIDQLLKDAEDLTKRQNFENAEAKLTRALTLMPTEAQRKEINSLLAELYYDWAIYKIDHIKQDSAAELLEKVINLDPTNTKAIKKLLEIWENNPTKTDKVIIAYETLYKTDTSNLQLAMKLADLYFKKGDQNKALEYYSIVCKSDENQRRALRDKMKGLFTDNCNNLANQRKFKEAKAMYESYSAMYPDVDPTPIDLYDFADKLVNLKPEDLDGRMSLAEYAKDKKLDAQAKEIAISVLKALPNSARGRALMDYYAQQDLIEAKEYFTKQQFYTAKNASRKIAENYPMLPDVVKEAKVINERADYEAKKIARAKKDQALEAVNIGSDYYKQALYHLELWRRTDIKKNTVINDKNYAIQYLSRAINAWEGALSIDPSLGDLVNGDLDAKIADAKSKLNMLTNPVPLSMPNFRY